MVSVFKHPLKPKKIGRELRSALKEVSPPAVPCYLQRCCDQQPLSLGCNQHPNEQDAKRFKVRHLKQPGQSEQPGKSLDAGFRNPKGLPGCINTALSIDSGAEPSTGHIAALLCYGSNKPFQLCDAASSAASAPVPFGR